jgi:16S rRNA (uracil1498-N3)-methyltransferase
MTRKCFLLEDPFSDADRVTLTGPTAHHLSAVLRIKAGDRIELRDGLGGAWLALVTRLDGSGVEVRLLARQQVASESPLVLTVALAAARVDRMELVIRQATELGAQRLIMFRAARSQYGLADGRADNRQRRWLKIAREALCQCGRVRIPEVVIYPDLKALLENLPARHPGGEPSLRILAWEEEQQQGMISLWQKSPRCRDVVVVIGPEGGFTAEEISSFRHARFHTVGLGPRILRFETAAVTLIAAAQLLWGDLGENAQ